MGKRVDTAVVSLWGADIGAVTWDGNTQLGAFQYMPDFVGSGIEPSPLMMPLKTSPFAFPELSRETFKGLPGMLADSLPDKFGSALIDRWLAESGIEYADFSPVDRLCYVGTRGMGALEFRPSISRQPLHDHPIDLDALVSLANNILNERSTISGTIKQDHDSLTEQTLSDLLQVGVSAGGARAKAVVGWNEETGEVRSGQTDLSAGFSHWLIKFDGITNNRDKELRDGQEYGLMEYAYYLMAIDAGIDMSECRILTEGERHHFMTRRFDRTKNGSKLHMQTLGAMAHLDFNLPGTASYEQAMSITEKLGLGMRALEQILRRAIFNIIARNQDDHVKNIAFLMDSSGEWRLAPAYDLTFAYNPSGLFTGQHQMVLNGKRDGFVYADIVAAAKRFAVPERRIRLIIEEVRLAVSKWRDITGKLNIAEQNIDSRAALHRDLFV